MIQLAAGGGVPLSHLPATKPFGEDGAKIEYHVTALAVYEIDPESEYPGGLVDANRPIRHLASGRGRNRLARRALTKD